MTLKRAVYESQSELPHGSFWLSGAPLSGPPTSTHSHTIQEYSDLITSQSNPEVRNLGKTGKRVGGDFKVAHRRVLGNTRVPEGYWSNCNSSGGNRTKRYIGGIGGHGAALTIGSTAWPDYLYTPVGELEAFGTSAIATVEPTNPLTGLAVTLGELRSEGIPSVPGIQLWRDRTDLARSAGSAYLSKEFGWDPLLSEIRNFVRVSRSHDRLLRDYERGSGRKIHRKLTMPASREVTVHADESGTRLYPSLSNDYFVVTPKSSQTLIVEKQRWFEGCFTYYLPPFDPDGSNWERNRRIAAKLYGVGITPEILWDLTPWSWAVDWVSNAGDVLHNIGAFRDNGLVMQYGYVMETISHHSIVQTYNMRSREIEWGGGSTYPSPTSASSHVVSTTKVRVTATPYGFGLDWSGFSPFQLSILVALGMSLG